MTTVIPDVGREWLSEKITNNQTDDVMAIAVGDGTTSPSASDTSLANEIYRSDVGNSNCTVKPTSNTGEVVGRLSVTGGQEVPTGSSITEIGLFSSSSNKLVYREVRDAAVTVDSGDRKTFEFTFSFTDS